MISDPRDDQAILNSKYSLVIAVAKRAREVVDRKEPVSPARKPVSVALDEITQGKIKIVMKKHESPPDEGQGTREEVEPLL